MKSSNLVQINLALAMACTCQVGLAQSTTGLDVTMRVIEDGQQPSGLIQQIELPPLEFFVRQDNELNQDATAEVVLEAQQDTISIVEDVNDVAVDAIRESISINGTSPDISVEPDVINDVIEIPGEIVDILDGALPLDNSLQDTLDGIAGGVTDGVTDDIVDNVTDSLPDPVTDIVDVTEDVVDNAVDNTSDAVNDVVSGATDDLPSVTSSLNGIEESEINQVEDIDVLNDSLPNDAFDTVPSTDEIEQDLVPIEPITDDVLNAVPEDIF